MNSKAFVFLGLLFAVLLLVTSAVAEETTSKEVNKEDEAKETNQFGGRHCPSRCCVFGPRGGCRQCCRIDEASQFTQAQPQTQTEDEEVADANYGSYYGGGGWGGGRGWGGGGGGGRGGGWGGGANGGEWGGGGCRFGCCGGYGGYGGGCRYCCTSAAEALSYMQNEAKP